MGTRTLLVASTGGHLEELHRLAVRMVPPVGDVEWATFDDPQSRSLLRDHVVHHVPYIPPRGYRPALQTVRTAARIVSQGGYDRIVSTGAGVALPFLLAGRLRRIPCHYIESAARSEGPSLTGRVVARLPGIRLYTQYASWADHRWHYRGSLFDAFASTDEAAAADHAIAKGPDAAPRARAVVVTLGTMRTYGFRAALEAVARALPDVLAPDGQVLWQVGSTDVAGVTLGGRPIDARDRVAADELRAAIASSDLVIAHAGIGSALTVLDAGRCPVLMSRRASRGEHVDDHQLLIAAALAQRGLAVSREPDDLDSGALRAAMRTRVRSAAHADFALLP